MSEVFLQVASRMEGISLSTSHDFGAHQPNPGKAMAHLSREGLRCLDRGAAFNVLWHHRHRFSIYVRNTVQASEP